MRWPEADGRFHEIAMSYYVAAGHITPREPEYYNLSADLINGADLFDNLSLLFVTHQCMFFSAELLCDQKQRSQAAHDIHEMLHSMIELDASVCVFCHEDYMMFSFMGYGMKCILSDWYPIYDRNDELIERMDISGVSMKNNHQYFLDLAYNLAREYYHYSNEMALNLVPVHEHSIMMWYDRAEEELIEAFQQNADYYIRQYGDDYVPYDASSKLPVYNAPRIMDMMLHAVVDLKDNPFHEEIEPYDDEDDDDSPDEDDAEDTSDVIIDESKPKTGDSEYEYIWVGGELVKRRKVKSSDKSVRTEKPKVADQPPRSKDSVLSAVERTLLRADRELDLYTIQDKSGINNLDDIIIALDALCAAGKVVRSWSRKMGGRSVYQMKKQDTPKTITNEGEFSLTSEKGRDVSASPERKNTRQEKQNLSNPKIESEIVRVLKAIEYPVDIDVLKKKSPFLSTVHEDVLSSLLYNLCISHQVIRLWMQSSRKYVYQINDPTTRLDNWISSQRRTTKKAASKQKSNTKKQKRP